MFFDFSICESPTAHYGLTLDTIYYISGDQTYNTPSKEITPGKTYLLYTLQGAGLVSFDGKTHTVSSNNFMYIQPTRDFSYRTKGSKWEFWWFEFWGECPVAPNQITHLLPDKLILMMMSKCLEYTKYGDWELSTSLLQSLNLLIKRNASRTSKDMLNEQLASTIENYIRCNYATVTVRDLSEEFGIEERTLRNLFTKTVGYSPKRLILKIRMEYVGNMLLTTSEPLSIIAQKTGFSSQYHLSKAFKEFYGISPDQYRKYIGLW